ncbi:retrovirus-related Pol polyprotein from type-2 retrotransposable element R2DM [Caerostris extrusa]|uniref:Retrovirus-related Pol polyprotein from type-2 retrotransposable element R2DM n=1 Tax=Caerostris extrusa TaxID=172846 RepID=A0AAV4SAL7_CAEEX|nr:retrovirus-related Pol polyprotein from type-2 retrotransposable element R2DM [Caerostris extrusa]
MYSVPPGSTPLEEIYHHPDPQGWRPGSCQTGDRSLFQTLPTRLLPNAWLRDFPTGVRDSMSSPHCQKGFMPFDGVLEHNFLVQQAMERARSTKRDICFLDVTNAFGALPHSAIFNALRGNGVGETFVRLVEDIYTGSSTSILTEEGVSPYIPISSGVKQGCPLSGLLFNIAIDPVLREIQGSSASHKILAFADDLCLIANSPDELQLGLDSVQLLLGKLHLHLNPGKSFSFHLHGATPVGVSTQNSFLVPTGLPPFGRRVSPLFGETGWFQPSTGLLIDK